MKLILFLLPIAFAADYLVSTATGATEVNCTYPLCSLCNSTTAYQISDISSFQIPNYLASTSMLLQEMIEEFSSYLNASTYLVSVGETGLCVEATEIADSNLQEMYPDLIDVEYKEIILIEIFDADIEVNNVIGRADRGVGNGYDWTDLHVKFSAYDNAVISSSVTFQLEEIWHILDLASQETQYLGISFLGVNMEYENEFRIYADYDREENQDFNVTIFNEVVLLGDFADALDYDLKCSEVQSPRGLDYVSLLLPNYAEMVFTTNNTDSFIQVLSVIEADSPDFSIAQGILIENPIAYLNIYHNSSYCKLDIQGEWNVPDTPQFTIDVISTKNEPYYAEAHITDPIAEISFTQLENLFIQLSADFSSIFPLYQTQTDLISRLYSIKCINTNLVLEFAPETYVTLDCDGKIVQEYDSKVNGYFGRFNTTVEDSFTFNNILQDSLGYLLGEGFASYSSITNLNFNTSTSDANLMESYLEEPYVFPAGIHFAYDINQISNCTEDTKCENTVIYNLTDPINMIGEYFPNDFYMSGEMDVVYVAHEVYFYDTLMVKYYEPLSPVSITGLLDILLDSDSFHTFTANVTLDEDGSGIYYLAGRLQEEWTTVFGVPGLLISSLELNYEIENRKILTEYNPGQASFSCEENKYCWNGEAYVEIDHNNYNYNQLDLVMQATDAETFFKSVAGIQATNLATTFNFTGGAKIDVQLRESANTEQGVIIEGNAEFLGLPCEFYIKTEINSSSFIADVDVTPFIMGYGNIFVMNVTGEEMTVDLDISENATFGTMEVNASMWTITEKTDLVMDDTLIYFKTTGYPFKGIYQMNLTVETEPSDDITKSTVFVYGDLSSDDISQLNSDMTALLENWIEQGLTALQMCESQVENQETVVSQSESKQCTDPCPTEEICTSPVTSSCIDYSYAMDCLQNNTACDSVSILCYSYTVYCLEETTYCVSYEKNMPNVCKEYKTECISTVDTCDKWYLDCVGEQTGTCEVIDFISTGECAETAFRCDMKEVPEMQCEASCEYEKLVLEDEYERLEYYQNISVETEGELGGFRNLSEFENLIDIKRGYFELEIIESGIGPGDIKFTFDLSVPDITNSNMADISVTINWHFFNSDENLDSLKYEIKKAIIDRSNNTLTYDLLEKSPIEVYLEH